MPYLLGVDGGQTSTTAVLMDATGRLLGAGHGGPANHIHEPGGVERVRRSLADAIAGARAAAGLPAAPIAFAYLGMTGGSARMEEVCRPVVDAERMALGHDSLIALTSVTFGRPGVVVIGGTGSVGFGRHASGRTARTGGWGYVFGDEGSGYWIAVRALNAIARAQDGIGPTTTLLEHVGRQLEVTTLEEIHALVYSGKLTRPDIAALAAAVSEAAEAGDSPADDILRDAGRKLGLLAAGVLRRLEMGGGPVEVGAVGGVFRAGERVLSPFTRVVLDEAPQAANVAARVPAAVAAALLALEQTGGVISDDVLANVTATLPGIGVIKR